MVSTVAELSRRLKRPPAAIGLPRLVLLTDTRRLADPLPAAAAIPTGSAVILRHYDDPGRRDLAIALATLCRRRGLRLLIGADVDLALAVGAAGVHLRERDADSGDGSWRHRCRPEWLVTVAAHSAQALVRAARAGADAALLSPVFSTASHPDVMPLGPIRFARLARTSPLPVYALGGVTAATAGRLKNAPAAGFAGIVGMIPTARTHADTAG